MTIGRGSFGALNVALLLAAGLGVGLFVLVEAKTASPLIRLEMFRNPVLSAGLATSVLVLTVAMATLVVGPFYLSQALGLDPAAVGLVMSSRPDLRGAERCSGRPHCRPLGRAVHEHRRAHRHGGRFVRPRHASGDFGIAGYVAALALLAPGYQLFQAANNTTVMMDVHADQRGVVSGLLNLSRNLGGITGASVMGAVFALASGPWRSRRPIPTAVATGMRITFVVAGILIVAALAIAVGGRALAPRRTSGLKA